MTGMRPALLALCLLLSFAAVVDGFGAAKAAAAAKRRLPFGLPGLAASQTSSETPPKKGHVSFDPAYKGVDLARAHECADHYGKCSVEEMQEIRDNLRRARVQRFMIRGDEAGEPGAAAGAPALEAVRSLEESLEHRLLEEELDLQLGMLRDANDEVRLEGGPGLFPEVEEPMAELPHLKDDTHAQHDREAVEAAEVLEALEETVLEESNLEAIVVCACIGAFLLFPHLLPS